MGGLHRGAAGAARDNHSRSSALVPLLFPYKRRRDTTPRHHSRSSCHSQVPLARSLGTRDRSLLWSTPGLLKGSIGADHVATAAAVAAAFEQPPGSVGVSSSLRGRPKMASVATAEACDANTALLATGELRVLQPIFKVYGQRQAFSGPIVTLKVFEDNVLVRDLLETSGDGQVLVIDGGGSLRCALVGGNLGQLAQNMGWSGIVVNGCIRDVDEINGCDIGVRALASHPQKSNKKGVGERRVPVHIGGTLIRTGEWLYADSDGILISKSELSI